MTAKMLCGNCESAVRPALPGSTLISLLLYVFLMIVGGLIYSVWRRSAAKVCPECRQPDLVPLGSTKAKRLLAERTF